MIHKNKNFNEFLTSGEAARRLGLTPDGVRAMERRGALKAVIKTAKGMRLFQSADVERLAHKREGKEEQQA